MESLHNNAWGQGALKSACIITISMIMFTVSSVSLSSKVAQAVVNPSPVLSVINAPYGVYFRNSTNQEDKDSVSGHGAYNGNKVEVMCSDYNGGSWNYYVRNLSLPLVPKSTHVNEGFLDGSYISDILLFAPYIPRCGGSAYYSPGDFGWVISTYGVIYAPSGATVTVDEISWKGCYSSTSGNFGSDVVNNRRITALSGWSLGFMGPIYFLRNYQEASKNIHYIVLLDPGNLTQLVGDCQSNKLSSIISTWLRYDPQNKLLVVSGQNTEDPKYDNDNKKDGGLKEILFKQIVADGVGNQVKVCDYESMIHKDVFYNFDKLVNRPPVDTTCPKADNGVVANNTNNQPWSPTTVSINQY